MKIAERLGNVRGAQLASLAFATVLLAVDGVTAAESWRGLVGFGGLLGIHGLAAYGVPVTLDGVSVASALLALRAELAGESSGAYRASMFAFTAASAAANWWHGRLTGGIEAALYLGGMSLATAWVFSLVLRQLRREDRRRAGRLTEQLPRFSAAHWLRFPLLTGAAWSIAVRDGLTSPTAALAAARAEREGRELARLPEVPDDAELAAMSKTDAIKIALAHCGNNVLDAVAWLAARDVQVSRPFVHDVKRGASGRGRRHRAPDTELAGLSATDAARLALSGGPRSRAALDLLRVNGSGGA